MKKIKIVFTSDSYQCEACGFSFADGFRAYLDDELIDEFTPRAYCYDGDHIEEHEIYKRLFEKLGYKLELEY